MRNVRGRETRFHAYQAETSRHPEWVYPRTRDWLLPRKRSLPAPQEENPSGRNRRRRRTNTTAHNGSLRSPPRITVYVPRARNERKPTGYYVPRAHGVGKRRPEVGAVRTVWFSPLFTISRLLGFSLKHTRAVYLSILRSESRNPYKYRVQSACVLTGLTPSPLKLRSFYVRVMLTIFFFFFKIFLSL